MAMPTSSTFKDDKLERMYRKTLPQPTESPDSGSTLSPQTLQEGTTRPVIERIQFVFERILELMPNGMRKDWRYTAVKTIMMESIKDLSLVPDETIIPMMREFSQAIAFIADGTMEDIEDADGPE